MSKRDNLDPKAAKKLLQCVEQLFSSGSAGSKTKSGSLFQAQKVDLGRGALLGMFGERILSCTYDVHLH